MSRTNKRGAEIRRIEVFRPGVFTALNGQTVTYSAEDVAALAESYDAEGAPAPVVVGHPKTDSPAYGWVKRLRWDADAERLYAEIGDVAPEFEQAVREGRYKKISISLFPPASPANPRPGKPYLKHVGFLGGAAPAVPGLRPVSLGAPGDAVTIELSDPDISLAASVFRSLREWLIGRFGQEEAEKAVPGHYIGWMEESQRRAEAEQAREEATKAGAFAVPDDADDHFPEKETDMSKDGQAGPGPAEIERLRQQLAEREARIARTEARQFADALAAEGRLPSGLTDDTAALIVALATGAEEVAFAAGDEGGARKLAPAEALKALLKRLPPAVEFGEAAAEDGQGSAPAPAEFAVPDGWGVDPGRMELHNRALAWMREHGGNDYDAALAAVSGH